MNDEVQVATASKAIISKTLINNHYLVSPGQSIEHYGWRFMPVNMNVSIISTIMHTSTKATSTLKFSTISMAKTTGTNKAVSDASKRETSTEIMKKKNKPIMELSDEEE